MSRAHELAAPLREALIAVPGADLRPCAICHSSVDASHSECYPCAHLGRFLEQPPPTILPIALSLEGAQLHYALRQYKDNGVAEVRSKFEWQLAGLLEVFMASHAMCVGPYDMVTGLPSRRGRTAFEAVTSKLGRFKSSYQPLLTVADPNIESHVLSDSRFVASPSARGRRVLVVDDTFTTGASVASAVQTLRSAGAEVNTAVVVGRHIKNSYGLSRDLLERIRTAGLEWTEHECVECRPLQTLF